MRDTRNLHIRLQEYADCFMETDPRKELRDICRNGIKGDATGDLTEVALKYLSLAILLGVEEEAQKILIRRKGDMQGYCKLNGEPDTRNHNPPPGLAKEMIGIIRCITDLEEDTGCRKLIYGLRNDQLEIDVEVKRVNGAEELTLIFPKIRLH
jgi:hypothetical protein